MESTKKRQTLFLLSFIMLSMLVWIKMPTAVHAEGVPVTITMTNTTTVSVNRKLALNTKTNVPCTLTYKVNKGSSYGIVSKNVFYAKKAGKIILTVTAVPKNSTIYTASQKTINLTILPKTPTNISVSRYNSNKTVKIHFTKVSGTTGYQLQYSTDPNFQSNVKSKRFTTTTVAFSVTASKIYYFRIRSFKKFGSGEKAYTLSSIWSTGRIKPQ